MEIFSILHTHWALVKVGDFNSLSQLKAKI